MNQSIQFPDREEWDPDREAMCFPALVNGMKLTCAIRGKDLLQRFKGEDPLSLFQEHRWDLEEEASDLIQQQQVDNQGWVWLT